MSNAVFPALAGLGWTVKRSPLWKTRVQESISGKEVRIADWSFPRWQWQLSFDFLRGDPVNAEFQALAGFFNQRLGMFDSFLYQDADDNSVAAQSLGTGDGATTSFQLVRVLGGFVEPILAPNAVPGVTVLINGVQQSSGFSVAPWGTSAPGSLTFTAAPAAGAPIAASFSYFFPCRFVEDSMDLEKFMVQLWQGKKVGFVSLKSS
jgi:uncharacterized protein (TIGR02217 family)